MTQHALNQAEPSPAAIRDALTHGDRTRFDLEFLSALNVAATTYRLDEMRRVIIKWGDRLELAKSA